MNIPKIALRNLSRHPLDSLLKLVGIAVTGAVMIVWGGLTGGFSKTLYESATSLELGHFQIHHAEYVDSQDIYDSLEVDQSFTNKLDEEGFAWSERLYHYALAASGELSAGVKIRGVDVDREKSVTDIHTAIDNGKWLDPSAPMQVVVGKILAKSLRLGIGSELVVVGQAIDGSLASEVFHIGGILKSINKDIDRRGVFSVEATFRELFVMQRGYHELAIKRLDLDESLTSAKERLDSIGSVPSSGVISSWRDIKPVLARMLDMLKVSILFTMAFTYIALGGIILNSTLLTIFDRLTEYGVMRAIGTSPKQIFLLILGESMWLGVFAAILTVGIGLPVALHFQEVGYDFRSVIDGHAFAGINVNPLIFGYVGFKQVASPVIFLLVMMPLAALYPALKAAKMEPLKAMKRT